MLAHKPFLKWAGSKRKSLDIIKGVIGPIEGKLIEPFVGSATVSLNMAARHYILADTNEDLITLYEHIQCYGQSFIEDCKVYFGLINNDVYNNPVIYYKLREYFNSNHIDPYEKSLVFVYLNRHAFNGLCRYNSKGKFNVPFGKYSKVYFPEKELLNFYEFSKKATFICCDFNTTIERFKNDGVIYCDPPYVPLSNTASFTNYSKDAFGIKQQKLLAKKAEESPSLFLISNHDNELTRELYKNADKIITKEIGRSVGANAKSRIKTKELLAIYY